MDRWCVSLDDLKQFKRMVGQAVSEGRICPTESLGLCKSTCMHPRTRFAAATRFQDRAVCLNKGGKHIIYNTKRG